MDQARGEAKLKKTETDKQIYGLRFLLLTYI